MKLTQKQLRSIIRSVIRETLIREYGYDDDEWNKGVDKYRNKDVQPWEPSTKVGGTKSRSQSKQTRSKTMTPTRTQRNPEEWDLVKEFGFEYVPWSEFVKRYPNAAKSFADNYTEGWSQDEIDRMGDPDPLKWDNLWDDETFVAPDGTPVIVGNITGPGGSVELGWNGKEWDEILTDEDDGSIEWFKN